MPHILRIATRQSPLALWQAEHVATRLMAHHPGLQVDLVKMVTQGDRILDAPLAKVGGKGLFVKELEQGLLEDRADIAVHSMKDVPAQLPEGLHLAAILLREDPRDAFVSNRYSSLAHLPPTARIGTSSLRRQSQLKLRLPECQLVSLRGNVGTRLDKLEQEGLDAIILATAGLIRLNLAHRITEVLPTECCLPAVGQGAIGIECRTEDPWVHELIALLHDQGTTDCVTAERAFNRRLDGGCQVPIAGHAVLDQDQLWLRGLVADPEGREVIQDQIEGPRSDGEILGVELAERLLARGAARLLSKVS